MSRDVNNLSMTLDSPDVTTLGEMTSFIVTVETADDWQRSLFIDFGENESEIETKNGNEYETPITHLHGHTQTQRIVNG